MASAFPCEYAGVEIELRMALEPWVVIGDDVAARQQARSVDSSVEVTVSVERMEEAL